jgi:ADP-ribose pyrophosphatase YjhB (NUDIX family)
MKGFDYCPLCGGRLAPEIRLPEGRQACGHCGETIYWNAKPCASALIVRGGDVLLVRRAIRPYKGYWDLPGGFCRYGEHPEEAVKREVREELGTAIDINRLFGIFVSRYGRGGDFVMDCNYLAKLKSGRMKPASDIDDYRWFHYTALPRRIAFSQNRIILEKWSDLAKKSGTGLS